MPLRALAVIGCWCVLGCTSSDSLDGVATTIEGCKEQFAASKGYGYSTDKGQTTTTDAAQSGSAGASHTTQTRPLTPLERAIAECQKGGTAIEEADSSHPGAVESTDSSESAPQPGTNCEYATLITHDAAVCIARAQGLPEALGYAAAIVYLTKFRRIVWLVNNTTERANGGEAGTSMTLDATTGEVLESGSWSAES